MNDELIEPDDSLEALRRLPGGARAGAALRALRRLDHRRPYILDTLLGLLVLLIGAATAVDPAAWPSGRHSTTLVALTLVTAVGQAAPLVWRRYAPTPTAAIVLAASVLDLALGSSSQSTLGLLLGVYTVARYDRFRRLVWVTGAGAAALVLAVFRVHPLDATGFPVHQRFATSVFLLWGMWSALLAAAVLGVAVRVRRERLSTLAERASRLETEREQRAQLATLTERARVSREMHDIVGHHLAVMIGLADSAGYADAARGPEMLRLIGDTGRQALVELRRTLGAMRANPVGSGAGVHDAPDLSPQPGLADLPGLLDRMRAAGPDVAYHPEGHTGAVPAGVQLAAYRIIQEALTNSLKHAGKKTRVSVAVTVTGRRVDLEVRDTGAPGRPAPKRARPAGGVGLAGIAERAALTGGVAEAGPLPGGGWSVHAVLPLAPRPEPAREELAQ